MTNDLFRSMLKEVVKEVFSEIEEERALRNNKKRNLDPDLITTNEAFKIVTKSRFYELVTHAGLKREKRGYAPNSPKLVSKAQLIRLNNTYK